MSDDVKTPGSADATLTTSKAGEAVAAAPPTDLPLPIVDRDAYEVLGEHARGGLGRVLLARDRRLGRVVAIKELTRGDHASLRRFQREALLTARLQHPSIVPILEAGYWDSGEPFYAMKFVAGRPLKQVIAESLPRPPHSASV